MPQLDDRITGALLDRYTLQRELGRGGMAVVYLAADGKLGRDVALKLLRPELSASLGAERFLREITLVAKLSHPHILTLHDSGAAEGQLFYTMPYLDGESLRDRLDREHQLPIAEAVRIACEVGDALAYAHEQGIIHRDIKPENILFEAGHAVVADFGIAHAVSTVASSRLTEIGVSIGTPAYMSPEQALGEAAIDGRSDVYALACVLFEMLTGTPPHRAATAQALLARKLSEATPRAGAIRRGIPPSVEAALARGLERNPADRFASAREFAAALTRAVAPARAPAFATLALVAVAVLGLTRALVLLLGLPDWLWYGALAVLGGGIPLLLTAESLALRRRATLLSRRRTITAGAVLLALVTAAGGLFLASRASGIGPFATLISRGALSPDARLLLADFAAVNVDTAIANAITRLVRLDLQRSSAVHAVDESDVWRVLARMQREPGRLDYATALEVASREGLPAVISGDVSYVGGKYLLSATLISAGDTAELYSWRQTASDTLDLIGAAERLSRALRAEIGENLRHVRSGQPLAWVTTASLPALVAFTQGIRAGLLDGDITRAVQLIEQAIGLDSTFAMAHFALFAAYSNSGRAVPAGAAIGNAYRYRERLPEHERLLVESAYHGQQGDTEREAAALLRLLAIDSTLSDAIIQLSDVRLRQRRFSEAAQLALRARAAGDSGFVAAWNAAEAMVAEGRFADADRLAAKASRVAASVLAGPLLLARRDYARALEFYRAQDEPELVRHVLAMQGRFLEAESSLGAAARAYPFWLRINLRFLGADTAAVSLLLDEHLAAIGWDTISSMRRDWRGLIVLLAELGRTQEARRHFAEWKATAPSDPRLREHAGQLEGAIALAELRFREAADAFLRWHAAPFFTAMHMYNRGLPEAADALDRLGQQDTAIALYERALALHSLQEASLSYDQFWYPWALLRLAELHQARGDRRRAIDYYSRFIELWQGADPPQQPQVRAARAAREELLARTG